MGKKLNAFLVGLMLVITSFSAIAEQDNTVTGDKATDMVADIVVARPLGLVSTVLGTVLTVISLPFTVPTGSVGDTARELIVKPAEYTFNRPLGDFHHCGEDRHPCGASD